MNLSRLMALGTLAGRGPLHGHQIRRLAELTNVGEWGGVSIGALYRELKLMAGEGLVEEVRTEQVGKRPARTVYAITDRGRLELRVLRERAIKTLHSAQDPLAVALIFSGVGDDSEETMSWLEARQGVLRLALREVAADRKRLVARGHINPLQATLMHRSELMLAAELDWHDELAEVIAGPTPDWLPGTRQPTGDAITDGGGTDGRGTGDGITDASI